ncbi:hypothetical protein N510_001926 [Firmicutes bacterium ASF500]|nr:hypothetical protein N510_001926 [Firmicutes bacterium ASF500]
MKVRRLVSLLCVLAICLGYLGGLTPADAAGASGPARSGGSVTYYVSLSGKGGNNGLSESSPFPGLSAVPWDQLIPGDKVLLNRGETFPGAIRMVDVHGTAGEPVTIGAYGEGDAPVIQTRGQGIWLPKTGNGNGGTPGKYVSSGITLYDCSYVTVENLTIVNVPDTMKSSFLYAGNFTDSVSGKSDFSDEKMVCSGIGVGATNAGAADGITLTNITVQGASDVLAVKADTSNSIDGDGVTLDTTGSPRTLTNTQGQTYYVSSLNGSDSNDGSSPEKAFYSLHKINELEMGAGTKVYLENGSVFEGQYLHLNGGGTTANPIIIDAYGKASLPKPQINANGEGVWYQNYRKNLPNPAHLNHGYVSSCILLYDVPGVEIRNIAMTNFGRYGETEGADFDYLGSYDGGTVPGETGYNSNGNTVGCYQWGGKMSRSGVAGVAQDKGTVKHTVLQNLDIENVYGNIVHKHMNNGGIYFTTARPINEGTTGIARFDDMRIEGCYLKRVSRWGIAAALTTYYDEVSTNDEQKVSDDRSKRYGTTNLYIGHNYLEEVGGDPVTPMHAFEPLVEYNVSYNGGREMGAPGGSSRLPVYMNGTYYRGNKWNVAAGIWPWKCKSAVFEHNECYTMLYSHLGGNNDGQPWDADSADSTVYQYNYSSGNSGGCIMFCLNNAYNSVFRYNVSFKDGKPWSESDPKTDANRRGILDPSGSPNGQFTNNTFVVAEGTPIYHYTSARHHTVRNNIFFNLGNPYAPEGGWNAASGLEFSKNIYVGFEQSGDGSYTQKDSTIYNPVQNQVKKRENTSGNSLTPYIYVYINGVEQESERIELNKDGTAKTVDPKTFTLNAGDTLSFLAFNEGPYSNASGNNGVWFNPVVTYEDVAYDPGDITVTGPDGEEIGSEVKLYTNTGDADLPHSITLRAALGESSNDSQKFNWTRPEGPEGRLSIVRSSDGTVTLTATEDEMNVGPVVIEVASVAFPDVTKQFTVNVVRKLKNPISIDGTPKFGEELVIHLNQLSMTEEGKQQLTYQWLRDGEAISGATAEKYTLTAEDIGCVISAQATAASSSFYEGTVTAEISGTVGKADNTDIPAGLTAVNCTTGDDGQITGLDAAVAYEYSADDGVTWTSVTDAESIDNLAAGNYQVRFAETDTHEAGTNAVTVTILAAGVTGYSITVDEVEGGVIGVSASQAVEGDTITVTLTPDPGFSLMPGSVKVEAEDGTEVTLEDGNTFVMPGANVTVTAVFTEKVLQLTHNLENILCDQAEHDHQIPYAKALDISLIAEEGYTMPSSVTVSLENGDEFTNYRYIHTAENPDQAIIRFDDGAITENLVITGAAKVKHYAVNYSVTNGLSAPEADAPRGVDHAQPYTGKLVAAEGYELPDSIQISVGGEPISDESYTYSKETGEFSINEGVIKGNVVVRAEGVSTGEAAVPVTGVTVNEEASVETGKSITLTATVAPASATDKSVRWSSSDTSVATVDKQGKVTGVSLGTAVITVTTEDGGFTASCTVTVVSPSSGSSSGGSSTPPSTTTKVEKNEDGSTTTTVVNKKTGTVTIETERPDGSKEIVETKRDGTVASTAIDPEGGKVEKVVTPEKDVSVTVTDKEGEVLVEAKIPAEVPKLDESQKFVDVSDSHFAAEAINNMAAMGVISGKGDQIFDTESPIKRNEFTKILFELSNGKPNYTLDFDDVTGGAWYADSVAWAAKAGVVKGVTDTEFAPERPITRQELAAMLCRYARLLGVDTTANSAGLDDFQDSASIGSWAVDDMSWCVEQGIIRGKSDAKLDPNAAATRAEATVMLQRFIDLIKK